MAGPARTQRHASSRSREAYATRQQVGADQAAVVELRVSDAKRSVVGRLVERRWLAPSLDVVLSTRFDWGNVFGNRNSRYHAGQKR